MAGFVVLDISQEDYDKEIRHNTIDKFVNELDKCCGWEKGCIESLEVTRTTYLQVAEYLKQEGGQWKD